MTIVNFAKMVFTDLANTLIHENPGILEVNLSSVKENLKIQDPHFDVSRSILMLSNTYKPAFVEHFQRVHSILKRSKGNPMIYVLCFAEAAHKKYSALKFLIVCSFISEIFLYLSQNLEPNKKNLYILQTTDALNDVFQSIFKEDFPPNGWTAIQNEASKLAKGYKFLKHFIYIKILDTISRQREDPILECNYESQNKYQQTDVTISATTSQEMVSVNIPSVPNSQVVVDIPVIEVPILSHDGFLTNETAYLPVTPVYPISFETVDQSPYLSYLLHASDDQTAAVTFENQPSGIEPNFQNVEIVESLNTQSLIQENSTARSYGDELMPFSCMVEASNIELQAQENLATRNSEIEPLPSFQTLLPSNIESQAQEKSIAKNSTNEPMPSFRTIETSNIELQAQNNLATRNSEVEPLPSFQMLLPSNMESQAQEKSIAKNSTNERMPSFRTIETSNIESKFQENLAERSSGDEPETLPLRQ